MNRLKVLHFVTDSCRYDNFCIIADHTNRHRFDLTIASIAADGALQEDMRGHNVKSFGLGFAGRKQYAQAVLKLARWLKKNKIDIIQTHLYDASLVGLAAAKLARAPLAVLTGHHSQELILHKETFHHNLPFWLDCLNSRWLSQYIIAPSEQMKENFIHYHSIPTERIAVVHHGFDFTIWKFSEKERERIRNELNLNGKIVFGAVGRIYWTKDYGMLFKAFAPVAAKFPEAVLLIVGSGDQTDLQQLAGKLSIGESQIVFTGWRTDAPNLFSAIDVFVHSSLAESFGMVIVEAMAMGKPVICTDVGIAREIIEDGVNGFLVPTADAEKFGSAMEKMIGQRPHWSEMGNINRERVQEFTAAKMVAGYEQCYIKWLRERKKLKNDFSV